MEPQAERLREGVFFAVVAFAVGAFAAVAFFVAAVDLAGFPDVPLFAVALFEVVVFEVVVFFVPDVALVVALDVDFLEGAAFLAAAVFLVVDVDFLPPVSLGAVRPRDRGLTSASPPGAGAPRDSRAALTLFSRAAIRSST